jgi:hypothetical protein
VGFHLPSGRCVLASAVAWKVTQFSSFYVFFILATVFMLIVWLIVLLKTAKGVAPAKYFFLRLSVAHEAFRIASIYYPCGYHDVDTVCPAIIKRDACPHSCRR